MIRYCYRCPACRTPADRLARMGKAPKWIKCRQCGSRARRDFVAEQVAVQVDTDFTRSDFARYEQRRSENKEVGKACLSRSLGRVPGIPKLMGRDGRPYAAFHNKQHRREVLKQCGVVDLDT